MSKIRLYADDAVIKASDLLAGPWQSGRFGNVSWLLFSFLTHSAFHGDEGLGTAFISLNHVFEIVHH